jgi:hypothetical protein
MSFWWTSKHPIDAGRTRGSVFAIEGLGLVACIGIVVACAVALWVVRL